MKTIFARGEHNFTNLDEAFRLLVSLPDVNERVFLHHALNAALFRSETAQFADPVTPMDAVFFVHAIRALASRRPILKDFLIGALRPDLEE